MKKEVEKKKESPKKQGKWEIRARKALPILFLMAWVLVSSIASQYVVGLFLVKIIGTSNMNESVLTAIYSLLSYILALVLIIFVPLAFIKKWSTTREEMGLNGLPSWTDIGLAPVGFVVATLAAAGLAAVFSIFPWFNASEAQSVGFNTYIAGGERVIAFLTLVVLAPIVEELIFRGFLYGRLRAKLGMVASIIITSLIFAVLHFQWNVSVNVFALSVVLCVLREVTGTIYAGMVTHMIKNGVAFYLLYVLGM